MSDAIAEPTAEPATPTESVEPVASSEPVQTDAAPQHESVAEGPGEHVDASPRFEGTAAIDAAAIEDAPQEGTFEPVGTGDVDSATTAADPAAPAVQADSAGATAGAVVAPAPTPVTVAATQRRRRERVSLPPALTLGLFVIGIVAGALVWRSVTAVPTVVEAFPALPLIGQPPVAAVVAEHLAANDAQALSDSLEQEALDAIRAQINPLTKVERVTFISATALEDQILVAYVVEGTDNTGARGIVGLIMVVRDGAVVAQ